MADERFQPRRRLALRLAAAVPLGLAAGVTAPASAQALPPGWPARPVRIVVPFPPGGIVDAFARSIATRLAEAWGSAVIVENRPGAASVIGTDAVAKAAPDGHTLLFTATTIAQLPALNSKLPFDPIASFAPILQTNSSVVWLCVGAGLPVRSVPELVRYARERPGKLSYASAGAGTTPHVYGHQFMRNAGLEMVHVPYKGNVQALTDLMGGEVATMFVNWSDARQHVASGRLAVLASSGTPRSRHTPDVPTLAELGYPGFETRSWGGFFAPAGTPEPIVEGLAAAVRQAVQAPDFRRRLDELALDPVDSSPALFSAAMRREVAVWKQLMAAADVKAD